MIGRLKEKVAAGKGKAMNGAVKQMVAGCKKAGMDKEQLLGMLRAVWKQQGYNDKQIKKCEQEVEKLM